MTGCVITGNTAIGNGGGLYLFNTSVTLINTVIAGNSAESGGGLWDDDSGVTLTNCTISGNTASTFTGGGLYGAFGSDTLTNCILWGDTAQTTGNEIQSGASNTMTISNTDIDQTGFAGSNNNIDADPKFVRNVGTNGASDFGDLHITGSSPAINAGANAAISGTTTDLDGNARIIEGTVDLGAYEAFPNHLAIFTQPGAIETAGADIPIVIDVEDQYGDIFATDNSSVSIGFANSPNGATLGGTSTAAVHNGIATFNAFDLAKAGTYSLSFADGSLAGATSNSFAIAPAAPASLTITQQPTNATAGQAISPVVVQVEDQFGNLATGTNVSVALGTAPSGATLTGTTPVISGAVDTFSNLSLADAGTYTLTFTDGSLPAVTSDSFTISSATVPPTLVATTLSIMTEPTNGTAGQSLPVTAIEVKDQNGNPIDGTSVTLSIASGASGAHLTGTTTVSTVNGIATFSDLALDRADTFTLTASDGNLSSVTTSSFAITYAGPTLVFVAEPGNATAGSKIPAIHISPENTSGNPLTTNKSKINLLLTSGGKLQGTTTASVKNGVAVFSNLSIQKAGTYTLTATDPTFASAISTTFTISAAAAAKMSFAPTPSGITHATPFNVSVNLFDRYGNLATNNASTVELALGSHPKTVTFTDLSATVTGGAADFDSVVLETPGSYTLIASDGKIKATTKKFSVS